MIKLEKKKIDPHAPALRSYEKLLPEGKGAVKIRILSETAACLPIVFPRDMWGRRVIVNCVVKYPCVCKIPAYCYNKRDVEAGLYKRVNDNTILPDAIIDRQPRSSSEEQATIVKNKWHIQGPNFRFNKMGYSGDATMLDSTINPKSLESSVAKNIKEGKVAYSL